MSSSGDATVMAPGPAWPGYDMTVIFAPLYWGTVMSFIFSGITLLQGYIYFPSKDRKAVQVVAATMLLLDSISTFLCAEGMYVYLIPNFGSMIPLGSLAISLSVDCYLSVLITFISQMYFAWQIYTVMGTNQNGLRRYILPVAVTLFAHVAFFGGIACSTIMIVDKTMILANRSYRFAVAVAIAKGAAALADVIATVSLCYGLSSARTGFQKTDGLIRTLVTYTVQRGIAVTLIQVMFLVLFYGTSQHLYWLALHVNMTRLYANTFFAMLNGRDRLKRTKGESEGSSTFIISAEQSRGNSRSDVGFKKESDMMFRSVDTQLSIAPSAVHLHTETEVREI
ncbi:hypothetical protein CPB85DRAFT_1440773 [Mucidula mucida]|nr:hypothetical protein CPB85DRAFT_1440773 [Mucidula mucida]